MKAADLVGIWDSPDNSRLTSKQVSFRLPVHVAAKISALCDMYPTKTRTQIVGDLLASALADVEKALPCMKGPSLGGHRDETGKELFEAVGPVVTFRDRTNHHFITLEIENGVENPKPFFDAALIWED